MKRTLAIKLFCIALLVGSTVIASGCATMNQFFSGAGFSGGGCSGST